MARQRLSEITIRQLPHPESGSTKHWDTTTPGFGIRCTKNSKSFIVMYGKDRRLRTLGKYPILSLSDARREAKLLLVTQPHKPRFIGLRELVSDFLDDCHARLRPSRPTSEFSIGAQNCSSSVTSDAGSITRPRRHRAAPWSDQDIRDTRALRPPRIFRAITKPYAKNRRD